MPKIVDKEQKNLKLPGSPFNSFQKKDLKTPPFRILRMPPVWGREQSTIISNPSLTY